MNNRPGRKKKKSAQVDQAFDHLLADKPRLPHGRNILANRINDTARQVWREHAGCTWRARRSFEHV